MVRLSLLISSNLIFCSREKEDANLRNFCDEKRRELYASDISKDLREQKEALLMKFQQIMHQKSERIREKKYDPLLEHPLMDKMLEYDIPQLCVDFDTLNLQTCFTSVDNYKYEEFSGNAQFFNILNGNVTNNTLAHMRMIMCSDTFQYHLSRGIRFGSINITKLIKRCISFGFDPFFEALATFGLKTTFEASIIEALLEQSEQKPPNDLIDLYDIYQCSHTTMSHFQSASHSDCENFDVLSSDFENTDGCMRLQNDVSSNMNYFSDILIAKVEKISGILNISTKLKIMDREYRILGWTIDHQDGQVSTNLLIHNEDFVTLKIYSNERSRVIELECDDIIKKFNIKYLYLEYIDPLKAEFAADLSKKRAKILNDRRHESVRVKKAVKANDF